VITERDQIGGGRRPQANSSASASRAGVFAGACTKPRRRATASRVCGRSGVSSCCPSARRRSLSGSTILTCFDAGQIDHTVSRELRHQAADGFERDGQEASDLGARHAQHEFGCASSHAIRSAPTGRAGRSQAVRLRPCSQASTSRRACGRSRDSSACRNAWRRAGHRFSGLFDTTVRETRTLQCPRARRRHTRGIRRQSPSNRACHRPR